MVALTAVSRDQDSIGRNHGEVFWFGASGDPSATHGVTSGYSAGDPDFRTSLTYGTSGLRLDFVPDAIGQLAKVDITMPGTSQRVLAEFGHQGSKPSSRKLHYDATKNGNTDWTFDEYGRFMQLAHSTPTASLPTFTYEFDANDNLRKETYSKAAGASQGVGDRFAYDAFDRLTDAWLGVDAATMASSLDPNQQASPVYIQRLTYGMDNAGSRETTQNEAGPGGVVATATYTTQETGAQAPSNRYTTISDAAGTEGLLYDSRGNLAAFKDLVFKYTAKNQLAEVWRVSAVASSSQGQGAASKKLRAASINTEAVERARRAVLKKVDFKSLVSKNAGRTLKGGASAPIESSATASPAELELVAVYGYDAFGRRLIRSVVGDNTYLSTYEAWREAEELIVQSNNGTLSHVADKQFVWGERINELLAYLQADGSGGWDEFFVHGGGQDSVIRVVDKNGDVVEGVDYGPYGQASVSSSPPGLLRNPYSWKGHRFDSETGFLQMRYRYYSPELGRYTSLDPIGVWGDAGNLGGGYTYAGNAPQVGYDPFGLQVVVWIGGLKDWKGEIVTTVMENRAGYGEHHYFEWDETDKAVKWIVARRDRLRAMQTLEDVFSETMGLFEGDLGLWADGMSFVSAASAIDDTTTVIGHSLGGKTAMDVTAALGDLGYNVDHLITLDAVSPKMWVNDPGNYSMWVNAYAPQTAMDYVASVPVVGNLVAGVLGLFGLVANSFDNWLATTGGQIGAEDGAVNVPVDVRHADANSFLNAALKKIKTMGGAIQ